MIVSKMASPSPFFLDEKGIKKSPIGIPSGTAAKERLKPA
jgi:hypothetical protein